MSTRRFFISPEQVEGEVVRFTEELLLHARKVLRLAVGDEVLLLDGCGRHYRCTIEELAAKEGQARIVEQWSASEGNMPVRLLQALPKGEKFDLILQKGCELGIGRFSPVITERSLPALKNDKAGKKLQRWRRIVAEAARQSERPVLPVCDPVQPLAQTLVESEEELKLILWERGAVPLADRLPDKPPADIALLVGPEGGFSEEEVERAQAAGFLPVSLGPRILRTETSGFAVAAVLEYLYGDFGSGRN